MEGGTRKGPKFIYRKVPSRDSGIKVFLKRKKRIDSKMCSCNYAYFCEITGALFLKNLSKTINKIKRFKKHTIESGEKATNNYVWHIG